MSGEMIYVVLAYVFAVACIVVGVRSKGVPRVLAVVLGVGAALAGRSCSGF